MSTTGRTARSARLYQQVAERLAQSIAAGTHGPGDRLPAERELAASFKVSRPTIREAIIALELDGLVEVRLGAGVYVTDSPEVAKPVGMDIGAFELTEARLLIEGEVAALAATLITDEELAGLERLLTELEKANDRGKGEEAVDRRFHQAIADATKNGAMSDIVDRLWTIRNRSPQSVRTFEKSRSKGYQPVLAEHRAIVDALRTRDPRQARAAMRAHLSRVLDYLLDATEVEALAEAKAKAKATRTRFARSKTDV